MVMLQAPGGLKARLADPKLRREVEAAVRRRVRGEDAEDLVQATLADVLSARQVPDEPDEFRRFVFGVARNKVFDHFRRRRHQAEGLDETQATAPEPPLSARDILRWAEGELGDPEAHSTLEWMLREGDGEKLEHIARDARLPATRVRKRVSRLRKLLRERWAAELALVGLLVLLSGLGMLYWYSQGRSSPGVVEREPSRPLPSAPRVTPTARPAGSAAPLPSAVAPTPTPPSSAPPLRKATPKAKPMTTELPPRPTPSKSNKGSSSEWDDPSLLKTQQKVAPSKVAPSLDEKK